MYNKDQVHGTHIQALSGALCQVLDTRSTVLHPCRKLRHQHGTKPTQLRHSCTRRWHKISHSSAQNTASLLWDPQPQWVCVSQGSAAGTCVQSVLHTGSHMTPSPRQSDPVKSCRRPQSRQNSSSHSHSLTTTASALLSECTYQHSPTADLYGDTTQPDTPPTPLQDLHHRDPSCCGSLLFVAGGWGAALAPSPRLLQQQ